MSRNHPPRLTTVVAACALALASVLVVSVPANAVDVDPAPIGAITGLGHGDFQGLAVAPDGTTYVAFQGLIAVYAPGASGNTAPERTITGTTTTLVDPGGLAIDASGNLWVADSSVAVLEFAAGASGDVAPLRTLTGPAGLLNAPVDLKIGSDGSIYVANAGSVDSGIYVFAKGANGTDAPTRSIVGTNTGFAATPSTFASGVALQSDGSIVVGVAYPHSVETFAADATGNATPEYKISGPATGLNAPLFVAVDQLGTIYAANSNSDNVTEYPQTANGDVAPTTRIVGPNSTLVEPYPVVVDSANNLFVGDFDAGAIDEFAANLAVTSVTSPTGSSTGGETVSIHGYGFATGATVTFGGVPATDVLVTSSMTITAVVPAHAAGVVSVGVTQAGTTATAVDAFTYDPALATTGLDPGPATGTGILLLLMGTTLLIHRRRMRNTVLQ
jgi:IPT/TIG domain